MGKVKRRTRDSGKPKKEPTHTIGRKLGSGKRLGSQAKRIVQNVRQWFEVEKRRQRSIHLNELNKRTSGATGVSERSVRRIHNEYVKNDGHFLTPVKRYALSRIRLNPDAFSKAALRRMVYEFYGRREYPTLTLLLHAAKEKGIFSGGRWCLWRTLHAMGFSYTKRSNKIFIYEQNSVIESRHRYLRSIRALRRGGTPIVYTDETWVNAHHAPDRVWVDADGKGGWKQPSGKGKRLIVVHAGSKSGWIPNAALVFRSKTNSADYHDEMNSEHYLEWWRETLLPNIPPSSAIVLDNAPYHNKQNDKPPTKSCTKAEMRGWLDRKGVEYEPTDLKVDLLCKIQHHRGAPLYLTDEIAEEKGHSVLRLPVAHCELNPIELAWASVKGFVARSNQLHTLAEVEELTPAGFAHTTPANWESFCEHVRELEKEYYERDGLMEDMVEELTITVDDDSEEEDSEDEEQALVDSDDKHIIDMALREANLEQSTSEFKPEIQVSVSNPQRPLSFPATSKGMDSNFLNSVLPLQ